MEELDHYYGYVVYQHTFKSYTDDLRMRIIDGRDRAKYIWMIKRLLLNIKKKLVMRLIYRHIAMILMI